MIVESLYKKIEDGRLGKNRGYSMGLPKLESIIDGVTKQTFTVICSDSGSGKSSLFSYAYLYRPLCEHIDDDNYRVFLFSLEMSSDMVLTKLLSNYLFENYGLELGMKELLSRKRDYTLPDEYYNIVLECKDWLEKVENHLTIYDKSTNAKLIYALLHKDLENIGTFEEEENHIKYTFDNPDLIYIVCIDHIGLLVPSKGNTLKQEIDIACKYLITLRNICGISPVVIQQVNRDHSNVERRKQGLTSFSLSDLKDSGGPAEAAENVITIYNPFRDKLSSYRGYDISQLGKNFRIIGVIKDRYGDSDVEIGTAFYGKINMWKECPLPDNIYDYSRYINPQWILDKNKTPEKMIEDKNEDSSKQTFKMTL